MKRLFSLIMTLLFFLGCEKPEQEAMISLDPEQETNISIPSDGDSFVVCFTSSQDWTAEVVYKSGGEGWANLNFASGEGGYSIERLKVYVHKNTESEPRSADVVITSGQKKVSVSFTQEKKSGLLPGPNPDLVFRLVDKSAEVPSEGGTVEVTVEYNVEYKCEITVDWIREIESKSYDQKTHVFEVLPNESENPRNTTISFCGNGTCIPFHIEQAGCPPKPEEPVFELSGGSADVGPEAGTINVTVRYNVDYSCEVKVDWIRETTTKAVNEKVHSFEILANENEDSRSGIITFTGNGEAMDFVVNQEGISPEPEDPVFKLSVQSAEIEAEGGFAEVSVTSNIDYSYELPVDWIKEVTTKAASEYVHTFEILPNETSEDRRAVISFCGNNNCLPFTVVQKGKKEVDRLEVDVKSISVEATGTETPITVTVTSDTSWEVTSDAGWCTVDPSSGVNDGSFNVSISENTSYEPRMAKVNVSSSDGHICREIAVIQAPEASGDDDSWQNEEFIHKSLALRFTADWCGFCPQMATALKNAQKELPDRIEAISVHGGGSGLASEASDVLTNYYGIGTFPTGLVDGWIWIQNGDIATTTQNFVNALKNTESNYDVVTGSSWKSTVSGNQIMLNLSLYIKETGSYKVTALAVEDGVVSYQADYNAGPSDSYVHDAIIRESFTDVTGDLFTVSAGAEQKDFSYSVTLPSGCNVENMRVVVYVQKKDSGSFVVDNAASAKVGLVKHLSVKSGNWGSGNEGVVPGDDINL